MLTKSNNLSLSQFGTHPKKLRGRTATECANLVASVPIHVPNNQVHTHSFSAGASLWHPCGGSIPRLINCINTSSSG